MKVQKSQMLSFVLLICIMLCQPAFCTDNRIVIHCDSNRGKIDKKIFGSNIIAYDPTTYENWIKDYYGYLLLDKAYLAILPGLCIMLLVMSFMLLGNGLRDALDTKKIK